MGAVFYYVNSNKIEHRRCPDSGRRLEKRSMSVGLRVSGAGRVKASGASGLAEPRQRRILDAIRSGGQALVSDLARNLGVSEMTIRRDLRILEERGLAVRVHGGALASGEARFTSRLGANSRLKAAAAAKLEPYLPESGCIYLDGSTTMLNLVRRLKGKTRLQVVTNNVETFNRLAALPGPSPLLVGGALDSRTDNLIGALALNSIASLGFDCAFFSAWGLDAATGMNEATLEDAVVKEGVARRARNVYLALDRSKFGVVAGGVWRHDPERTILATDLDPDDMRLDPFRSMFAGII